jgi:DTW domain-containing protein YfiP
MADAAEMSEQHASIGDYLDAFLTPEARQTHKSWPRIKCCGTSRSLYCCECYSLLVPKNDWPTAPPASRLPFHLDIILHDRRNAATGLHAKVLNTNLVFKDDGNVNNKVQVFDLERLDPLPTNYSEGAYLLFPSEDSVPLESVRAQVKTLVVLDCKWTRSSSRQDPRLTRLPRVHLTQPPAKSFYWRWHSAGPDCLSTMEAIYEAAKEVQRPAANEPSGLLTWLWLFGLQRAATGGVSHEEKQKQQALRRQKGTEKQLRDKEQGKLSSKRHKKVLESGKDMKQARKPQWMLSLETKSPAAEEG